MQFGDHMDKKEIKSIHKNIVETTKIGNVVFIESINQIV